MRTSKAFASACSLTALALVPGTTRAESEATETDPRLSTLARLASTVEPSELGEDDWPFNTLTTDLQTAVRRAVERRDPEGAVAEIASVLAGDRAAAETVLRSALSLVANPLAAPEANVADELESLLLDALSVHSDSPAVIAALALLEGLWVEGRVDLESADDRTAALLDRLASLPQPAATALALAERLEADDGLLPALLGLAATAEENEPRALELLVDSADAVLLKAAALERMCRIFAERAPHRLVATERRLLRALLAGGAGAEALEAFDAADPATRRSILAGEPPAAAVPDDPAWDLRLDLAAAAALEGRADRGRAFLDAVPPDRRIAGEPPAPSAGWQARRTAELARTQALLWQALDRFFAPRSDDPFELFAGLSPGFGAFTEDGVRGRATVEQALADLSLREGYASFEADLRRSVEDQLGQERWALGLSEDPGPDRSSSAFPLLHAVAEARFRSLERPLAVRVEPTTAGRDPGAPILARRLAESPRSPFVERSLPAGMPVGNLEKPLLPDGLTLPDGMAVIRAERAPGGALALTLSQALDPAGEVTGGGYWICRSTDGGASWQRLYTGLRELEPYQALSRSNLPLATTEGVQVEVFVRELDEGSITFPPVATQLRREAEGIVLDLRWSELERDSDGDGLTDLVEERLLTDPKAADTDGDGVDDGEDPLPGVAFVATREPASEALAALLAVISHDEARAILPRCADGSDGLCFGRPALGDSPTLFVVGDRRAWAGLAPARRTIVFTESEVEAAQDRLGVFYATRFPLFELDRAARKAVISWNRSWQGGSARLRLTADGWKVEIVSSWIT